jgi:hypothetical protein
LGATEGIEGPCFLEGEGSLAQVLSILLAGLLGAGFACPLFAQATKHPLTPAEDVGLTLVYQYGSGGVPSGGEVLKFSPDQRYFAVVSERGNLETNRPEDVLWLFRVADIEKFMSHLGQGKAPSPVRLLTVSPDVKGPFLENVRWLPDSRGMVFTRPVKSALTSFHQLCLINVDSGKMKALSPEDQDVTSFAVKSESTYVYRASAPKLLNAPPGNSNAPMVQTGKRNMMEVLFPMNEFYLPNLSPFPQEGLWLVTEGKARQILDSKEKAPGQIGLSPDGRYLLGTQSVEHPPADWAKYQAADTEIYKGMYKFPVPTSTYYLIDLKTGSKKQLFNAPRGGELGWWSSVDFDSNWSSDGKSLLLANVFLPLDSGDRKKDEEREKHPYVAVYRLDSGRLEGLLPVEAGLQEKRYFLADGFFEDSQTAVLKFDKLQMEPPSYTGPSIAVFEEGPNGSWKKVSEKDEDPRLEKFPIRIELKEAINQPPIVVATDKATGNSQVIWDPNPQLKAVDLGDAKAVTLKNVPGFPREQQMGLVFPPDYVPGKRYPLVIQTHGFTPHEFLTSGVFPTPFAARAIAARGMIVAQIQGIDELGYEEGMKSYDSIIEKLSEEGLIDPGRVGAIGFSSTVRVIMAHMAFGKNRLAAASVLDGVDSGYLQSVLWLDVEGDFETRYENGGLPFGDKGLKNWLAKSPLFNTDKMKTPLLILGFAPLGVLEQWEEYSSLYQQHKPVEFITLPPPYEHPSTNPKNRLYSETFNADWFDFWLNGHEDSDPTKAEQYKRWREMRKLQEKESNEPATTQAAAH